MYRWASGSLLLSGPGSPVPTGTKRATGQYCRPPRMLYVLSTCTYYIILIAQPSGIRTELSMTVQAKVDHLRQKN